MSHVEPEHSRRGCSYCGETNGHATNCDRPMLKRKRIKVRGVKGYATLIHGKGDSPFEGDLLCYERKLTAAERKRVVAYLKGKGAIR